MKEEFIIIKSMCKRRGKFIYIIQDKSVKECNGQFNKRVGRIFWDGEKWMCDSK